MKKQYKLAYRAFRRCLRYQSVESYRIFNSFPDHLKYSVIVSYEGKSALDATFQCSLFRMTVKRIGHFDRVVAIDYFNRQYALSGYLPFFVDVEKVAPIPFSRTELDEKITTVRVRK